MGAPPLNTQDIRPDRIGLPTGNGHGMWNNVHGDGFGHRGAFTPFTPFTPAKIVSRVMAAFTVKEP